MATGPPGARGRDARDRDVRADGCSELRRRVTPDCTALARGFAPCLPRGAGRDVILGMTTGKLYRAPFGPGGTAGIDENICRRLLDVALASGGDYADSFFEHRAAGSLFFEDGITKSASRGVTLGLSVRTSVDHGTAYDIAWQGKADAGGMAAALKLAQRLIQPASA